MAVTFLTNEDKKLIDVKIEKLSKENERLSEEVNALKENGTGNGLTTEMVTALDNMFKVCAYSKEDISEEYGAFKKAFGLEETGLVYELDEATTFTGGNYIDTDIKLYDEDKDFEIMIEFISDENYNMATLLHCMLEASPWSGLVINYQTSHNYVIAINDNKYTGLNPIGTARLVLVKINNYYAVKIMHEGLSEPQLVMERITDYAKLNNNLLLGAYQDNNGNKGRFWNGTISKCKVYVDDLPSDDETNAFLIGE